MYRTTFLFFLFFYMIRVKKYMSSYDTVSFGEQKGK